MSATSLLGVPLVRFWLAAAIGLALAALAPSAPMAQTRSKMSRIGLLCSASCQGPYQDAFLARLRELGYVEGRTMVIEPRAAGRREADLPVLAGELARSKVDVIVTDSTAAARAAKDATPTIPIVMAVSGNAAQIGLVASLARPGGNVTGVSLQTPELTAKLVELFKEVVPGASRVAVLSNPSNPQHQPTLQYAQQRAAALRVNLQPLEARGARDFERALSAASAGGATALLVLADTTFDSELERLVGLALENRLALLSLIQRFTEGGGFISYGPSPPDMFRQAAEFVDRILRGAKPSDLPVAQPVKFDFVINMKTANKLGLAVPSSVLARADRVVQ